MDLEYQQAAPPASHPPLEPITQAPALITFDPPTPASPAGYKSKKSVLFIGAAIDNIPLSEFVHVLIETRQLARAEPRIHGARYTAKMVRDLEDYFTELWVWLEFCKFLLRSLLI